MIALRSVWNWMRSNSRFVKSRLSLDSKLSGLFVVQLVDVPDEVVVESVPFRLLQNHVQHLAHDHESKRVELEKVNQEADEMREMQTTFREQIMVSHPSFITSNVADHSGTTARSNGGSRRNPEEITPQRIGPYSNSNATRRLSRGTYGTESEGE